MIYPFVSPSLALWSSTRAPIGIANNSHGNITNALIAEIRTGFLVSVTARSGAAATKTPSARFEARLAPHRRLKAGPKDFILASLVLVVI
jgi:hypothetical protein